MPRDLSLTFEFTTVTFLRRLRKVTGYLASPQGFWVFVIRFVLSKFAPSALAG